MADRFVVGDTVTLTNTFKVAGTATDPTTVSLVVTDPAGTATTYTYAGATITKTSTGLYAKNITASATGIWSYTWTGTGTAADVENGSFDVHALLPTTLDVLSQTEALEAVGLNTDTTGRLAAYVSAVSQQLDNLVGPVVQRTVTSESHDGGDDEVFLRQRPVASVTAVTEYRNTTAQALVAETNTTKTGYNYLLDPAAAGKLCRRSSNQDFPFPPGKSNVIVTYVAGRASTTGAVDAKYKQAAAMMLRNIWTAEAASGSETFGAFTDQAPNPLLGPGLLNKVVAMLDGEMQGPMVG